jgi:hypothetical protein
MAQIGDAQISPVRSSGRNYPKSSCGGSMDLDSIERIPSEEQSPQPLTVVE